MITTTNILLISIVLLYSIFWLWYTGRQKALSPQEIKDYMSQLEAIFSDEVALARVRNFMESDTGKGFIMVNLLQLHDSEPDTEPASKTLEKYSNVFLGKLLRRAGHPIAFGQVAAEALELWGVEDDAKWTSVGLIRYRSRRDMLEMVIDPIFKNIHPFKEQALKKTIAVPVDPWLSFGDLRLILGLIGVIIISLAI